MRRAGRNEDSSSRLGWELRWGVVVGASAVVQRPVDTCCELDQGASDSRALSSTAARAIMGGGLARARAEGRRSVGSLTRAGAGASLVVLSSTAHRVGRSRAIQIWRQHDEQHNAACGCGLLLMMLWNAARSGRKKQCAGSCRA